MAANRADGLETRNRVLASACRLFAEQGYHDTRTAEICRAARANVAAVNYHFGGKKQLYVAAWRHAIAQSVKTYPPDGGVPGAAPPAERLRGHVLALVRRFLDARSLDMKIADREMLHPSGLCAEVMHHSIKPLREMLENIVRALLGPDAAPEAVRLCAMSVHAQCHAVMAHERRLRNMPRDGRRRRPPPLAPGPDALAEHIVRFSLAGVRAVREDPRRGARAAAVKGGRR